MASRQVLSIRFSVNLLALSGSLQRLFRQGHSHWPFRHQGSCWKATVRCLRKWWSPASSGERSEVPQVTFGTLNLLGVPKIDLFRSSVRPEVPFWELPGFERWRRKNEALGLHGFMIHMLHWPDLIPGRKHEKSQTIFFAQTLGHKKKGGKKLGGHFCHLPTFFCGWTFCFLFSQFCGQPGGFFLTISQQGPSSSKTRGIRYDPRVACMSWKAIRILQFFNSIACAWEISQHF